MEFWVLGIIAGLGRGKPPVPPGRGIRWSPPWREPGSRRCAPGRPTPIPWEAANGLLPGRGEPGRRDDEDPCPPEPPGRGPGRAPEREAEPSAPLEADFAPPGRGAPGRGDPPGRGAAGLGAEAPGRGAPGLGAGRPGEGLGAGRAGSDGTADDGVGAPGVTTGFAAAGADGACPFAAGRGAGLAAGGFGAAGLAAGASVLGANASRTLRTTGASRVDEALETYSPMSVSFFKSSLLVIPISLAISWTRGLATILLRQGRHVLIEWS